MAAIALRRGGSFSSASGSSDFGTGSHDDDLGGGFTGGGVLGGGGVPTASSLYGHGQGLGPTLSSLQYDPDGPNSKRRHSLMENQNLSQSSGLGDDLSLLGECDNNSIRSTTDRQRPGRRASLSAAIELTRSPPKRTTSSTGQRRGRRNSLFGNSGKDKDKDKDNSDAIAKLSHKKGSRRASMAGYPAASSNSVAEPEPTPAFFQPRSKKDKNRPAPPDRRKTKSFEKNNDARRFTSQMRPGEKIKRPGKGGSRRASMSALPRRMSLGRSGGGSKSSNKGSQRSVLSNSNSGSGSDSYGDISDDDDYYGFSTSNHNTSSDGSGPALGRTKTAPATSYSKGGGRSSKDKALGKEDLGYGDDPEYDPQLPPPPAPIKRTGSSESIKRAFRSKRRGSKSKKGIKEDLGYGDSEEYDPQLPPPPPPAPPKRSGSGSGLKQAFRNRRGSTGTAASFTSTNAAQRSLKESLQWKASQHGATGGSIHTNRRTSTASSTATSVATDVASNVRNQQQRTPLDVPPPQQQRTPLDIPPQERRVPADIPPPRRVPADVPPPPPPRRGPADVPPGRRVPSDLPPSRIPADVPPGRRPSALAPSDMDSSASSFSMDSDLNPTPIQSNRKTREFAGSQHSDLSMVGNVSTRTGHNSAALGSMIMDDVSDGSHSSAGGALSLGGAAATGGNHERRRASRGMSVLQRQNTGTAAAQKSSLVANHGSAALHGSTASFNPYGSSRMSGSEDGDDDDEEDEEEDLKFDDSEPVARTSEARIDPTSPPAATISKSLSDDGDDEAPTTRSTTDTDPTLVTVTNTDESGAAPDFKLPDEGKHKDDGSDGSMTSEVPNEKDNMHDVDAQLEQIGATGDWSAGIEGGDWSQGVKDHMLVPNSSRIAESTRLLNQYPGSEVEYDAGLGYGYGYSHLQGGGAMNAYDDESERKEGDPDYEYGNGYGPSDLYDEDYSSFGWRENRPRTADSIEFINMEQLMSKAKNTKGLHLPTFTPAHGCTNASDFIVRCFVARLRAGMTVTKHSRSRFCKSHDRILHILPTGYHITWIPETEEEVLAKSTKKPPTKLDLTKCLEVRHAWSRDPKSSRYTGTSTLRAKCKEGAANRSFALIYSHRTVDFTAMTVDQCKILMEGFSALCFRLQMARLEQQDTDDDTTQHTATSAVVHDDDSTTASLTGTNMSAPWGL